MRAPVFETVNLRKVYRRSGVEALKGVSLRMEGREVFTILGRNGAGKTTFLRILATQLMPTGGQARVLGYDVLREAGEVRRRIAVMPQEALPFSAFTPWDHVYHILRIRGLLREEAGERTRGVLETLELSEYANVPADQLSGGLRHRILLAMAMATEAELLLLDEPTLGLDPVHRRRVWRTIRNYCREKGSVVLTTHYLDEAEILSDEVVIFEKGVVVARGTAEELKSRVKERVKVEVFGISTAEELSPFGKVVVVADRLRVLTDERSAEELVNLAIRRGWRAQVSPIALDDVFVDLLEVGEQ